MSKFLEVYREKCSPSHDTLDSYIKRLGISAGIPSLASKNVDTGYAGGVPNSLLAEQDLETTFLIQHGDEEIMACVHGDKATAKAVMESTELASIAEFDNYQGVQVFMTPEVSDTDGNPKGCYVVIGVDGSLQLFFSVQDARAYIDSVLVSKGQVEETGKELDAVAETAKDGDMTQTELVDNIKAIQQKRQKATIAAREKSGEVKKSFKETWGVISKGPESPVRK